MWEWHTLRDWTWLEILTLLRGSGARGQWFFPLHLLWPHEPSWPPGLHALCFRIVWNVVCLVCGASLGNQPGASPGLGQGATHLDWFTGRGLVVTRPFSPSWNKMKHQEFRKDKTTYSQEHYFSPRDRHYLFLWLDSEVAWGLVSMLTTDLFLREA